MNDPEPDRQILLTALVQAFGDERAQEIMDDPHAFSERQPKPGPVWMGLEGCWMFRMAGVGTVGVETDGYVHS